ncbi:hypothetical protein D3C78_911330 [compost metagenome]
MGAALQRRAEHGIGLLEARVDVAFQDARRLARLKVQRALELVAGQLAAQGPMARLQRCRVLGADQRHDQQGQTAQHDGAQQPGISVTLHDGLRDG